MNKIMRYILIGFAIGLLITLAYPLFAQDPTAPPSNESQEEEFESPDPSPPPKIILVQTSTIVPIETATVVVGTQISPEASIEEVTGILKPMALAFRKKEWALAFGFLLTLLVAIFHTTKAGDYLPPGWKRWTTMIVSMMLSTAAGLQANKSWTDILFTGVIVGFIAIGGWETVGRGLRDKFLNDQRGSK